MSAFDFSSTFPLSQEVLDAGATIGIDVSAIRQKYTTQKIVSNLGSSDDAIKTKAMVEDAERLRKMEAMQDGTYVEPTTVSSSSKRLDRIVVCQRCLGQGMVKTEYNFQIRESNCEECDAEGVLWKTDTGELVKKWLIPESEKVAAEPMSAEEARLLAEGVEAGLHRAHP